MAISDISLHNMTPRTDDLVRRLICQSARGRATVEAAAKVTLIGHQTVDSSMSSSSVTVVFARKYENKKFSAVAEKPRDRRICAIRIGGIDHAKNKTRHHLFCLLAQLW